MKSALTFILTTALVIGFWQRAKLKTIQVAEVRATSSQPSIPPLKQPPAVPLQNYQVGPPVSNEEFTEFTERIITLREELKNERRDTRGWSAAEDDPQLCAVLSRLTSQQIREVIETWERQSCARPENKNMGVHRFFNLAAMMNPQATLEAMFQLVEERGEKGGKIGSVAIPIKVWFAQNPSELLVWARERQAPDFYKEMLVTWKAAAAALIETTPETVRELVAHSDPLKDWQKQFSPEDILRELKTYEARLAFLRCLHAATGGTTTDWIVNGYAQAMSWHIPFGQAAMLADSLPGFRPANESTEFEGRTVYFGSLRYAIAEEFRDATVAARWNWLVSRAEDRPQGKKLEYLIGKWCDRDYGNNNYEDVAAWARSLPRGEERTEIRQAILAFCKEQLKKPDVIAEWEAP